MTQDGHSFNVDYYFGEFGDPHFQRNRFTSLNYRRPALPAGVIGEDPVAPRVWRDGSIPAEATLFGFPLGAPADYLNGAPSVPAVPWPITWFGQRAAETGLDPGIFPPPKTSFQALLTSNMGGAFTSGTFVFSVWTPGWSRPIGGGFFQVIFFQVPSPWSRLFACQPTYVLGGDNTNGSGDFLYLRCTDYDGHVSHWDDPNGWLLQPGEVFTLTVP